VLVEFQPDHVPGLNLVSIERELCGLLHGRWWIWSPRNS
jgi:hypothetical protein